MSERNPGSPSPDAELSDDELADVAGGMLKEGEYPIFDAARTVSNAQHDQAQRIVDNLKK
jgi:hypothetical protein